MKLMYVKENQFMFQKDPKGNLYNIFFDESGKQHRKKLKIKPNLQIQDKNCIMQSRIDGAKLLAEYQKNDQTIDFDLIKQNITFRTVPKRKPKILENKTQQKEETIVEPDNESESQEKHLFFKTQQMMIDCDYSKIEEIKHLIIEKKIDNVLLNQMIQFCVEKQKEINA